MSAETPKQGEQRTPEGAAEEEQNPERGGGEDEGVSGAVWLPFAPIPSEGTGSGKRQQGEDGQAAVIQQIRR